MDRDEIGEVVVDEFSAKFGDNFVDVFGPETGADIDVQTGAKIDNQNANAGNCASGTSRSRVGVEDLLLSRVCFHFRLALRGIQILPSKDGRNFSKPE